MLLLHGPSVLRLHPTLPTCSGTNWWHTAQRGMYRSRKHSKCQGRPSRSTKGTPEVVPMGRRQPLHGRVAGLAGWQAERGRRGPAGMPAPVKHTWLAPREAGSLVRLSRCDGLSPADKAARVPVAAQGRHKRPAAAQQGGDAAAAASAAAGGTRRARWLLCCRGSCLGPWRNRAKRGAGRARRCRCGRCGAGAQRASGSWLLLLMPALLLALLHVQLLLQGKSQRFVLAELAGGMIMPLQVLLVLRRSR